MHSSTQLSCIAYGVPFRLHAERDDLLPAMADQLPFGARINSSDAETAGSFILQAPPEAAQFNLLVDAAPVFTHPELAPVLEQLKQHLMVYVADHAPGQVFVHAGVVGWRDAAIVLPGPRFAGKTTLVAELVRAGATYYSDEYAVVDEAGQVHPYARDLQMREPGRPEQHAIPIESLHGVAGTGPLPVSQVIFAEFSPGATWNPQPVSPGMAVLEMLRHTIPIQRAPSRVLSSLTRMMHNAQAWRSQRGDARATAAALLAAQP